VGENWRLSTTARDLTADIHYLLIKVTPIERAIVLSDVVESFPGLYSYVLPL